MMEAPVLTSGFRFHWTRSRAEVRFLSQPPPDILSSFEEHIEDKGGDWELLWQEDIRKWCGLPDDPNDDPLYHTGRGWCPISSQAFDSMLS